MVCQQRHVLLALCTTLLALLAAQAHATTSYTNVFGRLTCYAEAVVKPDSTQQLAAAVKQFSEAAKQSGKPLKIRTSRTVFHSTASFTCPYTSDVIPVVPDTSSSAPSTVAVLTESFDKILEVDKSAYTVRVQAGLTILNLMRWAEKNGMSAEPGAPTSYAELTIGGVISANGHGTGSNVNSSMGDVTLEFTWIDAAGNVSVNDRNSAEGRGLAGGVGLIGIITEIKLQLKPLRNTKVVSKNLIPDNKIGQDVLNYLKVTPHVALMWRPDIKKYNVFLMYEMPELATPIKHDHIGLIFPLPQPISDAFQLMLLSLQADIHDTAVSRTLNPLNCLTTLTSSAYLRWASKSLLPQVPGAPLDIAVAQISAVGTTNRMMAGGCEPFCVWNSDLTTGDIEFAIELEDFPDWAEDIKKIINYDLKEGGLAHDRCMPFGSYIFLRFGRGVNDNTAVTSGMKNPIYVEMTYLSSKTRKLPGVPAKYQFVQDLVEALTLCKYKGRPHWGKNYDRTFVHPNCPLRDRYPNFDTQLELQAKYDPDKVFEPVLMHQIITRTPNFYGPQCDMKRQCYCTEDSHCADGFTCVPALSFPEYKVCKPAFTKANTG